MLVCFGMHDSTRYLQDALHLDKWCAVQEGDDRDVENQLVMLLEFDKFDLIKELLKNRTKIVWCMRLQRAQDEKEVARIEVRIMVFTCICCGCVGVETLTP